eukprot:11448048-Prorocentrum_lima.AAC.1
MERLPTGRRGYLSTQLGAMSLKPSVVQIGGAQGILSDMYNRKFGWNGSYDCLLHVLYRFSARQPDGSKAFADIHGDELLFRKELISNIIGAISPPCAGLQDASWHI